MIRAHWARPASIFLAGLMSGLMTACSQLPRTPEPPPYQAEPSAAHFEGRLAVRVDNLGAVLMALGAYEKLSGGLLTGEIKYDNADVGRGVLKAMFKEMG